MGSKSSKSAKYDLNDTEGSGKNSPKSTSKPELKEKEIQKISPLKNWLNDAKLVFDYSKKIQFKTADSAFQKFYQLCSEHVKFLERHQGTKKPNDALMKTEILAQMGIINELNSMVVKAIGIEKQYLSMIEASLGLFGWFQLNSLKESQKHIKEHINASVFFLNRVKTESSDLSEKELHKNLSENWLKNLWSFHSLVADLYPNGLWGSSPRYKYKDVTRGKSAISQSEFSQSEFSQSKISQ